MSLSTLATCLSVCFSEFCTTLRTSEETYQQGSTLSPSRLYPPRFDRLTDLGAAFWTNRQINHELRMPYPCIRPGAFEKQKCLVFDDCSLLAEGRRHLSSVVTLPILSDLIPGGFRFGLNLAVEFEPHSLWYETSLTIAADGMSNGIRTDYHTFQHIPSEVVDALSRLGLDVEKLEREGVFRILDTYTVTTGLGAPQRPSVGRPPYQTQSIKLADWSISAAQDIRSPRDIPEAEKSRLHIDDNTSVLLQYNTEKEMIDFWRTRFIPLSRARENVMFHSLVAGVYSEAFYRQFESLCDGIVDFRSQEQGGQMEHSIRVRAMRGRSFDSRWRQLRLADGAVTLTE